MTELKIAVLAKLREAQKMIHHDSDPQTYSYERRYRAQRYIALTPVIDECVSGVESAKTVGEARRAIDLALGSITTGIECNLIHRARKLIQKP